MVEILTPIEANSFFEFEDAGIEETITLDKGLGFWIIKELLEKIEGSINFVKINDRSHKIYLSFS